MSTPEILRYSAFAATPGGGNPAGVVLDARGLDDADMLAIADQVGYSETAFLTAPPVESPREGAPATAAVRYFSPSAEVPFCGHATVATAVALAERIGAGRYRFATPAGDIVLDARDEGGTVQVSFTSVEPQLRVFELAALADLLDILGLDRSDLHSDYPPREAFAGNWHPILVLADRELFHQFRFHPPTLAALMRERGWTGTITVLSALAPDAFEARNLFIAGRITEDPATGSAAASTGAYLRELGLITPPASITIHQGRHVGRPSILHVKVTPSGGVIVSGSATPIAKT